MNCEDIISFIVQIITCAVTIFYCFISYKLLSISQDNIYTERMRNKHAFVKKIEKCFNEMLNCKNKEDLDKIRYDILDEYYPNWDFIYLDDVLMDIRKVYKLKNKMLENGKTLKYKQNTIKPELDRLQAKLKQEIEKIKEYKYEA